MRTTSVLKKGLFIVSLCFMACAEKKPASQEQLITSASSTKDSSNVDSVKIKKKTVLDTIAFNAHYARMANGDTTGKWPVKIAYPSPGAILPFNRVIAYYGNYYSKQMGILGELPEDQMLESLQKEVEKWNKADSSNKAIPALHYIAVTAQSAAGKDGKYRLRMPFTQIDKAIEMAKKIDALVFIDIQVGKSTLQQEVPEFEKYLSMPNVHFGIDPEFSMKNGAAPGHEIGTFDAADINYVQDFMASIVQKNNIPPKILVIHRFTQRMVTNYKSIRDVPEVQLVMDMDGWGIPAKKVNTYKQFIYAEPVEYTGFKIFYKNDTHRVGQKQEMQPADLLKLIPQPVYIQYQ